MSIFLRRRPGYSVFSQVCFGEGQRTRRLQTSNYWFAPANMKMLYVLCTYGSLQPSLYSSWNSWSFTTSLLDWGLQKAGAGCRLLLPSVLKLTWADQHSHYADCPPTSLPSPPHMAFLIISEHYLSSGFFILWGAHLYRGGEHSAGWAVASVQLYQSQCWMYVGCTYLWNTHFKFATRHVTLCLAGQV